MFMVCCKLVLDIDFCKIPNFEFLTKNRQWLRFLKKIDPKLLLEKNRKKPHQKIGPSLI